MVQPEYLVSMFKNFESFKRFLVKYKRITKKGYYTNPEWDDVILKEIKTFPYGIILKSGFSNLFKYSLEPYSEHFCKIIIKDLRNNKSYALHIQNILREKFEIKRVRTNPELRF